METRYHLFPGQTLANTKVEDRGQALHIARDNWEKITKHLDRKKDIQKALDLEESKRRYLDEGSKNMIKNWDNSLENIRIRKEEERLRNIENLKEDRMRKFFQMTEEQAEVRRQYVEKVKKEMFMNRGFSKDINSALMTSEVAYEREKQKEFKKFLKKHEEEEDADYAKLVKEHAQKEAEENAEKKRKLFESKKERGIYLRKVIKENERNEKEAKETQLKKESIDNYKSIKEMEFIKRRENEQRALAKRAMYEDKLKYLAGVEDRKKQLAQEEKEKDAVLAIYQEAKQEIDCLRKQKEMEKQEALVARKAAMAKLLATGQSAKMAAEDNQLKKAIAEREAKEEERVREKAAYQEAIRRGRLEDRDNYLARKKEEQKKESELKKWEMVNRYKIDEYRMQYENDKKREQWKKILERRKELLDQMDEDSEERLRAKEMDDCMSRVSYADEDAKFFAYADEVIDLLKKKGRTTRPIERVILEYRKINSLMPEGVKSTACEDVLVEPKGKTSISREIFRNSVKKRTCKCNTSK